MRFLGEWVKKARLTQIHSVHYEPKMDSIKIDPEKFVDGTFDDDNKPEDFTTVTVKLATGFDIPRSHNVIERKDKITEFIKDNPSGKVISEPPLAKKFDAKDIDYSGYIEANSLFPWGNVAGVILEYVGIQDRYTNITPEVCDKWPVVLLTEFALQNYPRSSAVGYAARMAYCQHIEEDYYSVGYLWRELELIMKQETDLAAFEKEANLKKDGSKKGGKATTDKFAALRADCLGYVAAAYQLRGSSFLSDSIEAQAEAIREIALSERADEFIGPKGNHLSLKWFTIALEDFRADGQLGKAIEKAVKMNKA